MNPPAIIDDPENGGSDAGEWAKLMKFPPFAGRVLDFDDAATSAAVSGKPELAAPSDSSLHERGVSDE